MKPTPSMIVLRVLGILSFAAAAIRFAIVFLRTFHQSELPPPTPGFVASFAVDHITLALGATGVALCLLGLRNHLRTP